MNQLNGAIV